MMSSCIAEPNSKLRRSGKQSPSGCGAADWNSIRRRRKSSIAKTRIGRGTTRMRNLIFWALRFGPEDQRVAMGSSSSTSVQQSPTKRRKPFGTRFVAGGCPSAATRRSRICPACSIRSSEAGSNITGDTIARRCFRRGVDWIATWPYGPSENTRSCGIITGGLDTGSRASHGVSQSSLPIGRWEHAAWLLDGSCMS